MINRTMLKAINADINAALVAVGQAHGVQIKTGSGTFTGDNATVKLEIAAISEGGAVKTKEAADFERYAETWGLKASDLNTTFVNQGTEYTLIGAKPRSTKYPLLGQNSAGTIYKFPPTVVFILPGFKSSPSGIGLTEEVKREFGNLMGRLSPENLCCDGECSRAETNRRHAQIKREWKALEQRVGHSITEEQAYYW